MFSLIKEITEIPGPTGYEQRVQTYMYEKFCKYTNDVIVTNIGNIMAHFPGKGSKVLLNAHADEICYFVQSITDDGFLKITPWHLRYRGPEDRVPYGVVGQRALVLGDDDDINGVFATPTGHVLTESEVQKPLEYRDIFIDIGASSKTEVLEKGIHIGSPIIWNTRTEKFGEKIIGKAMDDRGGLAVMIKIAEKIKDQVPKCDLYMASTIQEEMGTRGSEALTLLKRVDTAISIEVGLVGDVPGVERDTMPTKLGEGLS